ncbi:uncharacterized protein LOC118747503 [Rhagoletis pomonella]|uniref:uncharacterized protein LOC118747503 n=1 Tax=Rhagoletis pomonella TaxID=28610 RepID=UPI00177D5292|nr:uncharacterized protein LOC118747503 [Rhagoletis pomonella]
MSLSSVPSENAIGLRKISDGASEVIRGLEAVEQNERDHWLIHILLAKLDPESRKKWIESSRTSIKPTVQEFLAFLDLRCEELELSQRKSSTSSTKPSAGGKLHASQSLVAVNNQQKCHSCNSAEHTLTKCPQFASLSIVERRSFVKIKSLCFNCLKRGHDAYKCKSSFRCKVCNRRHHTLVHQQSAEATSDNKSASAPTVPGAVSLNSVAKTMNLSHIGGCPSQYMHTSLLPTVVAEVRNAKGNFVECRILIDSASELSYVTEKFIQHLGISRTPSRIVICGISSVKADTTRGCSMLSLKSQVSQHILTAKVHILKQITTPLPRDNLQTVDKRFISNLILADPAFDRSSPIDVLLGADYAWDALTMEKIHDSQGKTIAISSIFGWIITSAESVNERQSVSSLIAVIDIDRSLRSFWEIEEVYPDANNDASSIIAEETFRKTHSRHVDGRYVVYLPFKEAEVHFSDTFQRALARFNAVERRLQKNSSLKAQYIDFMRQYVELGHMLTTKLRAVFDGSFEDTNGVSLNSKLHVGPSIQRNLISVCMRFRFHRFVFSADVVKMFRQIWVVEQHRNFQRILWREDPSDQLNHYQLCTVTYGTSSAPFLAVRVLEQLAEDYKMQYLVAAKVLLEDFYVDDVLTGAESEAELTAVRDQLVQLLSCAGLELRKWASNSRGIVEECSGVCDPRFLTQSGDGSTKVLGIYWNTNVDTIRYTVNLNSHINATKRHVLSDAAKIFDPLGLVAPVVIQFKILFQELWLHNLRWDDELPNNLADLWFKYRQDLYNLSNLVINRYVCNSTSVIELHGFSDASTKAYAAVVYCRRKDKYGKLHTSIIAAKTRVSPIKQISLPRLELCGAVLLTRLMRSVVESFAALLQRQLNATPSDTQRHCTSLNSCTLTAHTIQHNERQSVSVSAIPAKAAM